MVEADGPQAARLKRSSCSTCSGVSAIRGAAKSLDRRQAYRGVQQWPLSGLPIRRLPCGRPAAWNSAGQTNSPLWAVAPDPSPSRSCSNRIALWASGRKHPRAPEVLHLLTQGRRTVQPLERHDHRLDGLPAHIGRSSAAARLGADRRDDAIGGSIHRLLSAPYASLFGASIKQRGLQPEAPVRLEAPGNCAGSGKRWRPAEAAPAATKQHAGNRKPADATGQRSGAFASPSPTRKMASAPALPNTAPAGMGEHAEFPTAPMDRASVSGCSGRCGPFAPVDEALTPPSVTDDIPAVGAIADRPARRTDPAAGTAAYIPLAELWLARGPA